MVELENMDPEILTWNVMFLKGERQHWWDWLTPTDWRHVCAYGWKADRWVVYDVADIRSRIGVLSDQQFDTWRNEKIDRITAVVQFQTAEGGAISARLGLWCVTAVKHLLGLKSGALRPKALFNDLLGHGGQVIFRGAHSGRQSKSPKRERRGASRERAR